MKSNYPAPSKNALTGEYCILRPFDHAKHSAALYKAFQQDADGVDWMYLPYGPFDTFEAFTEWVESTCLDNDPLFYTVFVQRDDVSAGVPPQGSYEAVGMLSLMNIEPSHGRIEIGHVHYAPALQRTPAATEAFFLLMCHVFDELGYRRLEWKCDNANERSKRCAQRLGYKPEGVFRQHIVYKGRNRDTAWFSIIDKEWAELKLRFERWLRAENFDGAGVQVERLGA